MKILKFSLIALFIVSSFAACKKDKTVTPLPVVPPIIGKWTGYFDYSISNQSTSEIPFAYDIKENNVLHRLDENNSNKIKFTGTWNLASDNFTCNYNNGTKKVYLKALFRPSKGTLNGTWGFNEDANDQGTWNLAKIQIEAPLFEE